MKEIRKRGEFSRRLDEDIAAYQREARAMEEEERALYRPEGSSEASDPWSDNAGATEHDPGRPAASNERKPRGPDVAANERAAFPVDDKEQRLHSLEGSEDTSDPWSDDENGARGDPQVPVASNVPDPWGQDDAASGEQPWSDQESQQDWTADDEGAEAYAAALANVLDESNEHEAEEDDYNNALAALERLDAQRREAEEREAQRILELEAENRRREAARLKAQQAEGRRAAERLRRGREAERREAERQKAKLEEARREAGRAQEEAEWRSQAQDADHCVRVHTRECMVSNSAGHFYMGLLYQNICEKDILMFDRLDWSHFPGTYLYREHESQISNHIGPRDAPVDINSFHSIPCRKPVNYAYCAVFFPTKDEFNFTEGVHERGSSVYEKYLEYMAALPCYKAIIQNPPKTKVSGVFHDFTTFAIVLDGRKLQNSAPQSPGGWIEEHYDDASPLSEEKLSALPRPSN